MDPAGLVDTFRGFFDGIVVDAPCSGEGMFRKDENARNEWSPDHVILCANRQDMILDCAADMLNDGGRIAYSTCTFSPEENEQAIARFLNRHPEFRVVQPACAEHFSKGRPEWADGFAEAEKTVRIWPHKVDGEGHFLALLVKDGAASERKQGKTAKQKLDLTDFHAFCKEYLRNSKEWVDGRRFLTFGENLYLIPEEMPEMKKLKVLRPGLHVGALKKGRMEPSHALALFLKKDDFCRSLEIGTEELAERYLKGETLSIPEEQQNLKGWVLVTAGGYSLGFGKADRGVLKNHYPKGLRKP